MLHHPQTATGSLVVCICIIQPSMFTTILLLILLQTGSSLPKLNFSTALMSQPPPNFGISQVSPVSMSALVSAVRSPAGSQLPPPPGGAPMPPLPTIPNMPTLPPMPNMPGSMSSMAGPIRRRISDKSALSLAGGKILFRYRLFELI